MYESEVRCSGVFYWCYVDVPLVFRVASLLFHHCSGVFHCSAGVPYSVSGVPYGVPLIRWCSVFRCSVFWRSWFYSTPSLSSVFDCSYRQVGFGRFILSSYKKNTKKLSLQSKYKYIKNTVVTGIAQKSYKALFQLWSLTKKDALKLIN